MILHLWHGRLTPDQELDGWGFNGPVFNQQLDKIVVDADNNITIYGQSDQQKNIPIAQIPFDKEEGMWSFGGAWYGDISIATNQDNRECTDGVVVEHSKGATLFSWFQMTYGGRDRCGSSVCEEDAIEGAQEGTLTFYPLEATDAYGQPQNYEGKYQLHIESLESYKLSLKCECQNQYGLEVNDLFADDQDIDSYRTEGTSAKDAVQKKGEKYDLTAK